MRSATVLASGLLTVANAYTQPQANPTWGAITLPELTHPLTRGEDFKITWDPDFGGTVRPVDGLTVSLVLCRGNSNTCALDPGAIVEGVPAGQKEYTWHVPCDLPAGEQLTATGYGMLIIVDGSGEFQYSTQFSVLVGSTCPA
ncbi:hypothetical protein Slin15195_G046150 [Septoria linicola]|uniref:Yeast cell wall synthesis Kre9/Knh1-like N-terminal domain-containing protein n=1 Tax=Septoria linicola TaxID=215465 RepID=A0A9Q9AV78_9PEZI|nr:hypothetical protein Slin14017_G049680 [Septoria linicola]USW51296.1 hypothetical protein Slin15195_G046150 [Septoria linicola]